MSDLVLEKFSPTSDQADALEKMQNWLAGSPHSRQPFFLLEGYAGTGKSYSSTELVRRGNFKPSEICYTAPTNKAVKVLRNYLDGAGLGNSPTRTIYSLLGLSLQANVEVKEITKPEEPVDLSRFKLIVVDEASMINRFLMEAIEEAYADWKVPFLFMGDPAQLPPIGEISSPVFKIPNRALLTEVLRYDNAILDLATSIRKIVDHPFPSIKIETNPPVFRLNRGDFRAKILQYLPEFIEGDAKVIGWRNVTVDAFNRTVRNSIYGIEAARSSPWLPGDQIVAKEPVKDLEGNIILHTAEEATVNEAIIREHPFHSEIECYDISVKDENNRPRTLFVPTPTGQIELNGMLHRISRDAKSGKGYKWKEFWDLKESFHVIKHSYAITSHGAQGSSYIRTFIDLEDIMLNRNRSEAFRSLYVAETRAREEVNIS